MRLRHPLLECIQYQVAENPTNSLLKYKDIYFLNKQLCFSCSTGPIPFSASITSSMVYWSFSSGWLSHTHKKASRVFNIAVFQISIQHKMGGMGAKTSFKSLSSYLFYFPLARIVSPLYPCQTNCWQRIIQLLYWLRPNMI